MHDKIKAATVAIVLYHPDLPEGPYQRPYTIKGTGFCIHPEGVVITCGHVLTEVFIDPVNRPPHVIFHRPEPAGDPRLWMHIIRATGSTAGLKFVQNNLARILDIGVLLLPPPSEDYPNGYPTVEIAHAADIHEMMDIGTCGFPFASYLHDQVGTSGSSFTKGIVSSVLPWSGVSEDRLVGYQLDLTAGPGNSGGPAFSLVNGKVFGVLKGGIEHNKVEVFARAEPLFPLICEHIIREVRKAIGLP
jgi:hypothetical protein